MNKIILIKIIMLLLIMQIVFVMKSGITSNSNKSSTNYESDWIEKKLANRIKVKITDNAGKIVGKEQYNLTIKLKFGTNGQTIDYFNQTEVLLDLTIKEFKIIVQSNLELSISYLQFFFLESFQASADAQTSFIVIHSTSKTTSINNGISILIFSLIIISINKRTKTYA